MASLLLGALPIPSQSLGLIKSRISFYQSESLATSFPSAKAPISHSAITTTPPPVPTEEIRKLKEERGKRFNHSFGNVPPVPVALFPNCIVRQKVLQPFRNQVVGQDDISQSKKTYCSTVIFISIFLNA
ncbi:hypothetical protein G4B88_030365 [Cannabis sativa]|uniref:Uncharacterized protein n=1 Tax=Cannabis sativa TaxID=3483 RepID=A0A7J6E223_CANSA|nr:hypothetical protein G4B88_030365 [Cannabis sativa]